jgi:hypothetical protein
MLPRVNMLSRPASLSKLGNIATGRESMAPNGVNDSWFMPPLTSW